MQLLVFIASNADVISPILKDLMERGIHGGTVIECEGMLQALYESSVEPPPLFGSLRQFLRPESAKGKILFLALHDEQFEAARAVIHGVCGGLDKPNSGVLFTLPIGYAEGI